MSIIPKIKEKIGDLNIYYNYNENYQLVSIMNINEKENYLTSQIATYEKGKIQEIYLFKNGNATNKYNYTYSKNKPLKKIVTYDIKGKKITKKEEKIFKYEFY